MTRATQETLAYASWLDGGCMLAQEAVEHSALLKRAWGRGTEERAMALTKLFAVVLIPRWLRAHGLASPGLDEAAKVNAAYKALFSILGDEAVLPLADALNLHSQYVYEWNCSAGLVKIAATESLHFADVFQNPDAYIYHAAAPYRARQRIGRDGVIDAPGGALSEGLLILLGSYNEVQAQTDREIGINPNSPGVFLWAYYLVFDKALAICGAGSSVDWEHQRFPITSSKDMCWIGDGQRSLGALCKAENLGPWLARLAQVQHALIETDKSWVSKAYDGPRAWTRG